MNLSENQFELIEAYLANQLSPADRASFETDIAGDAEFQAEVNRQRDLRLGLRALGIERVLARAKAQVEQMNSSVEETSRTSSASVNQPVVRPLNAWRYWAAAASVVLLLGVGYYTYQQSGSRRAEIAYADTFSPTSSDQLLKEFPTGSLPPSARAQLLDALTNYRAGHYDKVIAQLKTLPADKQTIHYKTYFLGLSYLANNQPGNAIPLLKQARTAPSSTIRQKADWFLALAYVKNGETKKALPMLNQISTDKANPFRSLAQQVLQKIR